MCLGCNNVACFPDLREEWWKEGDRDWSQSCFVYVRTSSSNKELNSLLQEDMLIFLWGKWTWNNRWRRLKRQDLPERRVKTPERTLGCSEAMCVRLRTNGLLNYLEEARTLFVELWLSNKCFCWRGTIYLAAWNYEVHSFLLWLCKVPLRNWRVAPEEQSEIVRPGLYIYV